MKSCLVLLFTLLWLIVAYVIFWIVGNQIFVNDKAKRYVGVFVLDLERTNLGIYSDSIDLYRDLTIELKQNKRFKLNKSVPFIADTTGKWKVGRPSKLNYIYYDNWKNEYKKGITGDWFWLEDGNILCIQSITPRADQLRKSDVRVVYFKKIEHE